MASGLALPRLRRWGLRECGTVGEIFLKINQKCLYLNVEKITDQYFQNIIN